MKKFIETDRSTMIEILKSRIEHAKRAIERDSDRAAFLAHKVQVAELDLQIASLALAKLGHNEVI